MAPAPPPAVVVPSPGGADEQQQRGRDHHHEPAGVERQQHGNEDDNDGAGDLSASLALAEDLLHEGALDDAEGFAWRALRDRCATPGDVTRAFCVLLQCDFEARRCVEWDCGRGVPPTRGGADALRSRTTRQHAPPKPKKHPHHHPHPHQNNTKQHRLTNLDDACLACARPLETLPVAVPLLWGVIALELGETDAARPALVRYCSSAATSTTSTTSSTLSRADALALARLLAVRVLAAAGRDADAARAWLAEDARRAAPLLSAEQRRLLVGEVDEAEAEARRVAEEEEAAVAAAASSEAAGGDRGPGTALAALLKATTGAGAGGGGASGDGGGNGFAAAATAAASATPVQVHAGSDLMTMTGEMMTMGASCPRADDTAATSGDVDRSWRSGGGGGGGNGGGSNGGSDQSSKYAASQQRQPGGGQPPPPPPPSAPREAEAAAAARAPHHHAAAAARPTPPLPPSSSSSWRQWASDAWASSPTVQGALSALNLEGAGPGQVAAGAGAAALVAYSLWRERRAVKGAARRAAAAAAAALMQTGGMAFGLVPNPMAAAPRAQYGP
jgi:hypothetical protein